MAIYICGYCDGMNGRDLLVRKKGQVEGLIDQLF